MFDTKNKLEYEWKMRLLEDKYERLASHFERRCHELEQAHERLLKHLGLIELERPAITELVGRTPENETNDGD